MPKECAVKSVQIVLKRHFTHGQNASLASQSVRVTKFARLRSFSQLHSFFDQIPVCVARVHFEFSALGKERFLLPFLPCSWPAAELCLCIFCLLD